MNASGTDRNSFANEDEIGNTRGLCAVTGCTGQACQVIQGSRVVAPGTNYMFLLCARHSSRVFNWSMEFLSGVVQ
jgi:hypothetical protein